MSLKKKQIREKFFSDVMARDGNKCRVCGNSMAPLDAHHITDRKQMPFGGYIAPNGIALCSSCHKKAERWHKSGGTEWVEGYHPDDLYALIGSSYAQAFEASQELGLEEKT